MHLPWLAIVDLGGLDDAVAQVVHALSGRGVTTRAVGVEDLGAAPRESGCALALLHARALSLETLDVLRLLRRRGVPTVVVCDRLEDESELVLLHGGATVVFGLPVPQPLLTARLVALTAGLASTPGRTSDDVRTLDAVSIDVRRREVRVGDRHVPLTRTEFELLVVLARDPEAVLGRDVLLGAVDGGPVGSRSLESHLSRLRLKIVAAGGPRLVAPVRGVGYRLRGPAPEDLSPRRPPP